MARLYQRTRRRLGIALAVAIGLTVLSGVVAPLLSDDLAHRLPGIELAFADEPHDGG